MPISASSLPVAYRVRQQLACGGAIEFPQHGGRERRGRPVVHDACRRALRPCAGSTSSRFDLMQGHDDRQAMVFVQRLQHLHHAARRLGIERSDRFVGEDDARPLHECARERGALLLTARNVLARSLHMLADAHSPQSDDIAQRMLRARKAAR